jgi:hypothetical protein
MNITTDELDRMKQKFLENNKIKVYGKQKKPKFITSDLLTIYSGHTIEKVL